jgi:hypothetical protein
MAIPLLFKDIHMKEQATLVARCTDEQTWLHRARLEALYDDDREITAENEVTQGASKPNHRSMRRENLVKTMPVRLN